MLPPTGTQKSRQENSAAFFVFWPRPPVLYLWAFNRGLQLFILGTVKGIGTMTQPEFATDLNSSATTRSRSPIRAPGAVLSFDALGEGFVLTTEANWP